ncbi:MAG: hypothetical protein NTW61_08105 [Candidatus Melainabacteria bacterium]|nr:hypothetical protein [Candidatus Melainabacteria bacterium]
MNATEVPEFIASLTNDETTKVAVVQKWVLEKFVWAYFGILAIILLLPLIIHHMPISKENLVVMKELYTYFSPVLNGFMNLIGIVIGFYFGSKNKAE